jgi:hypothetical protein
MIRYALVCELEHPFEGWFAASTDYDDQQARGLIECPLCGSREVRKQIMAPAVVGARSAESASDSPGQLRAMMTRAMSRLRDHVEETFDYVGDAFAAEARAIHEGRGEDRGIYGEATPEQVRDLVEDGVAVAPLPPAPPKKTAIN